VTRWFLAALRDARYAPQELPRFAFNRLLAGIGAGVRLSASANARACCCGVAGGRRQTGRSDHPFGNAGRDDFSTSIVVLSWSSATAERIDALNGAAVGGLRVSSRRFAQKQRMLDYSSSPSASIIRKQFSASENGALIPLFSQWFRSCIPYFAKTSGATFRSLQANFLQSSGLRRKSTEFFL
jgi:hypothetical protein